MKEVILPHGTLKQGMAGHSDDSGVFCSNMPRKNKECVAQGGVRSSLDRIRIEGCRPPVIRTVTLNAQFALCEGSVSPHSLAAIAILESWSTSQGGWKPTSFVATRNQATSGGGAEVRFNPVRTQLFLMTNAALNVAQLHVRSRGSEGSSNPLSPLSVRPVRICGHIESC